MEFKGTKRKWNYYLGNTEYIITDTLGNNILSIEQLDSLEEAEANAKLIASAPELLEVSQLLLHYHMCEQERLTSGQPTSTQWMEVTNKLAQIISQALGKEADNEGNTSK